MADLDNINAEVDASSLYREEIVTARTVGTTHVFTPITPDGERDTARDPIFSGEIQLVTQMGPLPISFEIEAKTLSEAVAKYSESAKEGVHRTIERLQEMRREAASKIVTPGSPSFGIPPAPSGKIQMP